MSNSNDEDISILLKQWDETRETISELEKKMEKYKRLASRFMLKKNTTELVYGKYVLKQKKLSRETISKKDLPKDIWKMYSKNIEYDAYYLRKK